jgi:hypothetical protein
MDGMKNGNDYGWLIARTNPLPIVHQEKLEQAG